MFFWDEKKTHKTIRCMDIRRTKNIYDIGTRTNAHWHELDWGVGCHNVYYFIFYKLNLCNCNNPFFNEFVTFYKKKSHKIPYCLCIPNSFWNTHQTDYCKLINTWLNKLFFLFWMNDVWGRIKNHEQKFENICYDMNFMMKFAYLNLKKQERKLFFCK